MVSEVSSQKVDVDCTSSSDKPASLRLKYLHPDYIDVIDNNTSHCDGVVNKSRYPLALLAETCNSIGRSVPHSSSSSTTVSHHNFNQHQHQHHQPLKITSTLLHTPPSSLSSSCLFHTSFNSPSSSLSSSNSNNQQPECRKRKYSNISSSDSSNMSTNPNYLPSNTELLSILTLLNRNFPLLNPYSATASPSPPSLSESKLNSKTIKYCMYCGKYIPNIHQLLQHIQSSHSESHTDMAFPFTLNNHNFNTTTTTTTNNNNNNKNQYSPNLNELSYLNFLKLFPEKSIFPSQPIKSHYYPFSPPSPPILTPTIGPLHFNQNTNISFM